MFLETELQKLCEVNDLTIILGLIFIILILWPRLFGAHPDIDPYILNHQADFSPVRKSKESPIYRSLISPIGFPLISGLQIAQGYSFRNGDIRDIWTLAKKGKIYYLDSLTHTVSPDIDSSRFYIDLDQLDKSIKELAVGFMNTIINNDKIGLNLESEDKVKSSQVIQSEKSTYSGSSIAVLLPQNITNLTVSFAAAFSDIPVILVPDNSDPIVHLMVSKPTTIFTSFEYKDLINEILNKVSTIKNVFITYDRRNDLNKSSLDEYIKKFKNINFYSCNSVSASIESNPVSIDIQGGTYHKNIMIDSGLTALPKKLINPAYITTTSDKNKIVPIIYSHSSMVSGMGGVLKSLPFEISPKSSDRIAILESWNDIYGRVMLYSAFVSSATVEIIDAINTSVENDNVSHWLNRFLKITKPTILIAPQRYLWPYVDTGITSFLFAFKLLLSRRLLSRGILPKHALLFQFESVKTVFTRIDSPQTLEDLSALSPSSSYSGSASGSVKTTLTSNMLSILRAKFGARIIYSLTSPWIAGPITSTTAYDYRIFADEYSETMLGPISPSLEAIVRDVADLKAQEGKGALYVRGPSSSSPSEWVNTEHLGRWGVDNCFWKF